MDQSWRSLIDLNRSILHINPAFPSSLKESVQNAIHQHDTPSNYNYFVWVLSSGTSTINKNHFKLIALTHDAFINSAQAVNEHLQSSPSDIWFNILPLYHVSGLSILYRSFLLNNKCYNLWSDQFKWCPIEFSQHLVETKATLTSLVPTQVFDIIKKNIPAPKTIRAVLVGGAHLNLELYIKARQLGWPLLPSFGMTEAASQIATAELISINSQFQYPELKVLKHFQVKTQSDHSLLLKGPSLFKGFYSFDNKSQFTWHTPFIDNGWYKTQDCGVFNNGLLTLLSRTDEQIKIKGELVNLAYLRNQLESFCAKNNMSFDCTISAIPDLRLGHKLVLVGNTPKEELLKILSIFNSNVLSFEKLLDTFENIKIPRNSLGKIQHNQLIQELLSTLGQ